MTNLTWLPSAALETLKKRTAIFNQIRDFFAARQVLEVETPLLCKTSVTDPHINSMSVYFRDPTHTKEQPYYLQTSPEYAMKRLLAAGSGAIYQITKAFRQGETGRLHNPEFTLLEWYRPGFNHHQLMDEIDELLQLLLQSLPAERKCYQNLFQSFLNLDPHHTSTQEIAYILKQKQINLASEIPDVDTGLNLLMTHYIEPRLGKERPCFVYDYPASQASLARLQPDLNNTAARFEVYVQGMELANGFHELRDVAEQRLRFKKNICDREKLGLTCMAIDEVFLSALAHGLPDCSGVALGLDRLIMLATGKKTIAEVLAFDFTRV